MSPVRLQPFTDPFAAIRSNSEAFNVRIPTQFDDDSLYPADKQRRRRSMPYRQIMRMALAMVLLVVVMNAASQKELYEPFFPASVTSSDAGGVVVDGNNSMAGSDIQHPSAEKQPSELQRSTSFLNDAESRVASLPVDQQVQIACSLIQSLGGQQARPLSIVLKDASFSLPPDRSQADQRAFAGAVIDAVVRKAEERIVDGAVWRSEDRDGLRLRLMQNQFGVGVGDDGGVAASVVGVLPMLQQPDAFRGQRVQVVGRLAKAEQIQDPIEQNPIPTHWKLWIQPTSGVARPIVALVTNLPPSLAKNHQSESQRNDLSKTDSKPTVRVTGTFFKRLAYRSSIGADLAPVVVGRLALAEKSPASQAPRPLKQNASGIPPNRSPGKAWAMLVASVGTGIVVAAWLMWRSSVDAKYLRRKRRASKSISLQVPDVD